MFSFLNLNKIVKDKGLILVLISFLLLNLWHPFFLGYIIDDWNYITHYHYLHNLPDNPFNFQILNYFMQCFGNRPITAITFYIGYSFAGGTNYLIWHFWLLFLYFIAIITFRRFSNKFLELLNLRTRKIIDEFPVLFFMASPWLLAYNHWISLSMSLPFLIFFNLSMLFLLKSWITEKNYFFLSSFFLLISYLSYEAFYFQWILFLAIGFLILKNQQDYKKKIIVPFIVFSIVQIIVIIWNRISIPYFAYIVNKATNPYLIQTFLANIISLPYVFVYSFLYLSIILIPIFAYLLIIFFRRSSNKFEKDLYIISALFAIGIMLSLFLFAAAGYSIWGLGMRSRTLIVFSFYVSIFLGVVLNYIYLHNLIKKNTIKYLVISTLFLLSLQNVSNTLDWVKAWNIQKEVILKIPFEKIKQTDKNAIILIDGVNKYNWVSVFDTQWSINAQINFGKYVVLKQKYIDSSVYRNYCVGRAILHPIKNTALVNYWNGKTLYQFYPSKNEEHQNNLKSYFYSRNYSVDGSELWVWNMGNNQFKKIKSESKLTFGPIKNYDYWLTSLWNSLKNK